MSRKTSLALFTALIAPLAWNDVAQTQTPPPQFPNMTFFITSTSGPDGANFGGIEGADKHCQDLAAKAGAAGKTWRAYLSTQAESGKSAINARDRIGKGPQRSCSGRIHLTITSCRKRLRPRADRYRDRRRAHGRTEGSQ